MKKIVILMLALMLALTSVSALAANQSKTGEGELTVALKYSMPESFEWSAPSEVTLTDDIFGDGMKDVIKVTLTTAKLKRDSKVCFRLTDSNVTFSGPGILDVSIDKNVFFMSDEGAYDYFSDFIANEDKDYVKVGDYIGYVTIEASIQ